MKKYTIKPLEWKESVVGGSVQLNTTIELLACDMRVANCGVWWFFAEYHDDGSWHADEPFESMESAKLAAEQWYHDRLTAALVEVKEEA